MMKNAFFALALVLLSPVHGAQELALVYIDYADEQPGGPQGDYLFLPDKEGLISLDQVSPKANLPAVEPNKVIPTLEKAYPSLVGKISLSKHSIDTEKLAAAGKIHVFGSVTNPGNQNAGPFGECITAAKPTPFGAVMRILVIREQKLYCYNLSDKSHAGVQLEPGSIVYVPMKRVVGR